MMKLVSWGFLVLAAAPGAWGKACYKESVPHSPPIVARVCRRSALVAAIPALQRNGFLNPDITQTQINMAPTFYASLLELYTMPALVRATFAKNRAPTLEFGAFLTTPDQFGHLHTHLAFSFTMSRATEKRIDWPHFAPGNLMKITPFHYSSWWYAQIRDEPGAP